MKIIKVLILVLIVVMIAIQFVPDGIPDNKPEDNRTLAHDTLVTPDVLAILKKSCFDCHSNQTDFPWYAGIAPSSWLLADHINEGRKNLNFSEWQDFSKRKKVGKLEDIQEQVKKGEMPLKSYTLIHKKAVLTSEEIQTLIKWTDEATGRLVK
ncbi:MAG TPA: heme-binding domain-containing protein [Bacteroidales bacterium]|nr:heme-binding domain-containing protein [Bacteroidales bacterium]